MELIDLIHKELPQIQCGRCETPGCKQYAEAIVNGSPHDRCVPGGIKTLKKLNAISNTNYISVNSEYFKDVYYAERPPSERLLTKKLDLRGVNKMRDWRISLKEYIETYYTDYLNQ